MKLKKKYLVLLIQPLLLLFIAKISEVKNKIPNITNSATTAALTFGYNTEISETENKITTDHDHDSYITTQIFNELASEIFTATLK